jgi:hypothetical protein
MNPLRNPPRPPKTFERMKRVHYLLLGLLVSLCLAAASPTLPPTRIAPGTGVTVVTNGVNSFTLSASGGGGDVYSASNNTFTGTNTFNGRIVSSVSPFVTSSGYIGVGASPSAPFHYTTSTTQDGLRLTRTGATAGDYELYVTSAGQFAFNNYTGGAGNRAILGLDGRWSFGPQVRATPLSAHLYVENSTAAGAALVLRAATSQSAQLLAIGNSSGTQIGMRIRKDGILMLGTEVSNTVNPLNGTGTCNIDMSDLNWGLRTGTAQDINFDVYNSGTPISALSITQAGLVTARKLSVGTTGATITSILSATATLNFDLTGLVVEDKTITVTGAGDGDVVTVGVPSGSVTATVQYTGWVSATNTVTVRARTAVIGEDPPSGTFRATVIRN